MQLLRLFIGFPHVQNKCGSFNRASLQSAKRLRNETKQIETKWKKNRNETKQIETKPNETNDMACHRGQKSLFSKIIFFNIGKFIF